MQNDAKMQNTALKKRLRNLPVVILLTYTFSILFFYYDAAVWRLALTPEILKPLIAIVSGLCLLSYFWIGSAGLKALFIVHLFGGMGIVTSVIIQQKALTELVIIAVQRGFFVLIVLGLYLLEREREREVKVQDGHKGVGSWY